MELLSPAGDFEAVKAAVLYGADAVYVGGNVFGLRVNAGFDCAELTQAVDYAHGQNVAVYLTCNTVPNNSDIDLFPEFIKQAAATGIDAVIVSDMGILDLVKNHAPELPVHISTQAGVMNYACANMMYKLGAKRVILAREVSLDEIKSIRDRTPPELEIEAFVHGAMCVSFSGRCLLSSYLTARDANRGACSHPCRWSYYLMEESRPNEFFNIFEDGKGSYILNSKDLCMIDYIDKLSKSGVSSLKIEGRAKTAYYTAVITNAYRAAVNAFSAGERLPEWAEREILCVSHRPYCTGFYLSGDCATHGKNDYKSAGYIRECDFIGTVDGYNGNTLEITQRNYFTLCDTVEAVVPACPPERLLINEMYNAAGERVEVANHAMEKLYIPHEKGFAAGAFLRKVIKAH